MISIRDRRSNLLGFGQLLRQQPKQSTQSAVYQASRGQFIKYQEISTYGTVDSHHLSTKVTLIWQ